MGEKERNDVRPGLEVREEDKGNGGREIKDREDSD